jgi:hypothetical protein
MARLYRNVILILASFLAFSLESFGAANTEDGMETAHNVNFDDDLIVIDQWFYIVPIKDGIRASRVRARSFVVHSDQSFGIYAKFQSKKPKVIREVRLTVPNSPENFPCSKCQPGELKISDDGKTVIVKSEIESSKGFAGFYWGIGSQDPRGKYRMELFIDGFRIAVYYFEVI